MSCCDPSRRSRRGCHIQHDAGETSQHLCAYASGAANGERVGTSHMHDALYRVSPSDTKWQWVTNTIIAADRGPTAEMLMGLEIRRHVNSGPWYRAHRGLWELAPLLFAGRVLRVRDTAFPADAEF